MFTGFPINSIILLLAVMIGAGAGAWFILSQGLNKVQVAPGVQRAWRWGVAILLTIWLVARLALAVNPPNVAALILNLITALFFTFGVTAGTLPLILSPVFRQIIHAIPETWLIGLHAIRAVDGILFLALLDMKLLPPQFALPAGYGDILVGLLAMGIVYILLQKKPYGRALAIGWNVLGLLDFVTAMVTGLIFITQFSAQLATSGASVSYLNYVLIVPAFEVPLFTALHIYSLSQMSSKHAGAPEQATNHFKITLP